MDNRLYERRKELGLTLEEVGKIVGVSKSTVRKWETGYIENMKRDKIALLAEALHVSPLYIMGIDAGPEQANDKEYIQFQINSSFPGTDRKQAKSQGNKREISGELNKLIEEIKNDNEGPLYYNGEPLDKKHLELLSNALELALNEVKNRNKVVPFQKDYLEPQAAHERTDIEVTDEMRKHDDDIMDDDDFWNK